MKKTPRSGDPRFIENKGKRMKNWEDDGVQLRLSVEKEREIGENIRTRVRERRERPRGANRECVRVGERNPEGKDEKREAEEGAEDGPELQTFTDLPARASFPPFKFRTIFFALSFLPLELLGRLLRERILITRSGWPTPRPTMSTRRATSWTRERTSRM